MDNLKRTPLFPVYEKYGAKLMEFGGWEMPVQFSSIIEEHNAVRSSAGLFDVSHMGEIRIEGAEAENFLQYIATNDITKLVDGQVQYTFMCYPNGGVVDDLLVCKFSSESYLLVVNASNIEKDYEWIQKHVHGKGVHVENISDSTALLALQGPLAESILQQFTDFPLADMKFYSFKQIQVSGVEAVVSRTGYTGEDGFEIYVSPDAVVELWEQLMEKGADEGLKPCGLGARDTLRFEAGLPLYGHELSDTITPLEAGLGFFVDLNGSDFIGRDSLLAQKYAGIQRKVIGFEMIDRGIPRAGFKIVKGEQEIGYVTSGSYSPTLEKNLGMALVKAEFSDVGTEFEVLRGERRLRARIIPKPFYKKQYRRS